MVFIQEKIMAEIEIGKFTLESLTTGMYNNPEIVYREYIQNAVDSFDNAVSKKLMKLDDCRIEIIVDADRQEISIKDNGTGIGKEFAVKTLLDIGNSTKTHTSNRGFRGIGRLGGLSYCKKLSFCTSAQNEPEKTLVTFDCAKLKELLIPGQATEYNLQKVISVVTEVKVLSEQASAHYFIVKMEGVDDISTLLDIEFVKDYIAQVAPIPFRDRFYWGRELKNEFAKSNFNVAEYAVFVGDSFETLSQVYKPYKITIDVSARAGVDKDEIQGISYFDIKDSSAKTLARGWYGELDFYGTIADDKISGIRIRQGNILIGDNKTLSPYFLESRFNNWCVGELYIVSDDLIPNARRDGFESNKAFSEFCDCFKKTIGIEIGLKIRTASKNRNNPMKKVLTKTQKTIEAVEKVLESGFNSSFEKDQIAKNLDSARKDLYVIPKDAPTEISTQKAGLMDKLSALVTEVDESNNYKTKKDISSDFSKSEKKIIQAMLEVLTKNFERSILNIVLQIAFTLLGRPNVKIAICNPTQIITVFNGLYKEFLQELKKKG